jgi:hypothetical protein
MGTKRTAELWNAMAANEEDLDYSELPARSEEPEEEDEDWGKYITLRWQFRVRTDDAVDLAWYFQQGPKPKLTKGNERRWNSIHKRLNGHGFWLRLAFTPDHMLQARDREIVQETSWDWEFHDRAEQEYAHFRENTARAKLIREGKIKLVPPREKWVPVDDPPGKRPDKTLRPDFPGNVWLASIFTALKSLTCGPSKAADSAGFRARSHHLMEGEWMC